MYSNLRNSVHKLVWLLSPLLLLTGHAAWSQCTNGAAFGTFTAPTNNITLAMSTCIFGGEYNTINGAVAGQTYQFTCTGAGNYLTVHQGTPGGTVLAFGFSPISATVTVSGPIYLHVNTTAGCGTDGTCHSTFIQCTSCSGPPPITNDVCTSAISLACGQTVTGTTTGAGIDVVPTCTTTFGTSGGVWYTFLGDGQSTTLSMCGSGYDSKIGVFTGTCASPVCVVGNDDFCGLQSQVTFTSVCGTTYYVLVTGFSTNTGAFTLLRTCTPPDPCTSIGTMVCTTPVTATTCGAGAWNPPATSCGFTTPGQERIYSFTATVSGTHTLVITAASGGFGDYFFKLASGGCNNSGWTCIGDASAPESNVFGPLTAGVTYYILFDPETTGTQSQTFRIDCPAAGSPPVCATTPSPANGANAGCPNSAQILGWAAAATATSYDVYFGTTAVPPFVGNTAATTFNVGILAGGTYFWRIAPRNAIGPNTTCTTWTFTKADVTPPVITCPANVSANNSPATACSAVVTYGSVSATDLCGAPAIVLQSGLASGSVFPVGVNVVVFRATDPTGNSATCSFTVTVIDNTLPNITCPPSIVKNNDPGLCGSTTVYATPTATDNCSVSSVTQIGGLASGSFFPVGVTTNVWRANDASNNTRTCSFTVTVNDNQLPTITCPANLELGNDWGFCSRTIPYLGGIFVGDNCGIIATFNSSPGTFPLGTTTVTHTAQDISGNTATCTQTVTIEDIQQPDVFCPANIVTLTDEGNCSATVDFLVNASDNCPGAILEYSQDPLTSFELGYTNVTATMTDAGGLWSNCTFQIYVKPRVETCNGTDDDCDGLVDEAEDWHAVVKESANNGGPFESYGLSVDIDGDWAIVGSNHKDITGQNVGSAFLLYRDEGGTNNWGQVAQLLPGVVDDGDFFGGSVAISNGVAVVGASQDDEGAANAGAVYVFYQSSGDPNQWDLLKKIIANDPTAGAEFGNSVSLDDSRLLVGAHLDDEQGNEAGAAYLFVRNLGGTDNWGQSAKLKATGGEATDRMGGSVSMDGVRALVGATGDDDKGDNAGAAYIFEQNQGGANAWGQEAKLLANQGQPGDNFGTAVSLSGGYALVGADGNDIKGPNAGAAFVFKHTGADTWTQETIILEYNGANGDHFGDGAALDGDYATVSAPGDDPFGQNSGRAFVFLRQDIGWVQVGLLNDANGKSNDAMGSTLAISGHSIIVGIPNDAVGANVQQGSIMIFEGLCAGVDPRGESEQVIDNQAFDVRCYPVPFSDELTVEVNAYAEDVRISIINTLGQEVSSLYQGALNGPGIFQLQSGRMHPGIYFLKVQAGDKTQTKTIVLSR